MKKIIIVYTPVLHDGYIQFFNNHSDVKEIYVLGEELIQEVYYLSKEIRQVKPEVMISVLRALFQKKKINILDQSNLKEIVWEKVQVIMPNEDVSKILWEKYFPKQEVMLDSIFLRWDKHNTVLEKPVVPDKYISRNNFDKNILHQALDEAEKSSDWWRRVGAFIIKDQNIILKAYNHHVPSEHMPYVFGDPRNAFSKGIHIELSTSIHAEAQIISEAAKRGISLQGADLYVTTFPCPPCAKLIAYSGIKRLFCLGGYGVLDGEKILKSKKVKIIFVE